MEKVTRRLYVGGLSSSISQRDLQERFGKFGEVSDVEIITRKDDTGAPLKTFGYINITLAEADFRKCMTVLNKSKWKGGTLQIEVAKECFLHRLAQERQLAAEKSQTLKVQHKEGLLESFKKAGVENFHMKAAVPGTEIPGHKDWVVSKFGRVLPVLHLQAQNKKKVFKYDPSKHSHNIKKLETDVVAATPVSSLTWEILGGDDEISRKRKGEFPPHRTAQTKMRKNMPGCEEPMEKMWPVTFKSNCNSPASCWNGSLKTPSEPCHVRDGDVDSEEEIKVLVESENTQNVRMSTKCGEADDDDIMEVVGEDFTVIQSRSLVESDEEQDYDSADTDEILTRCKRPAGQSCAQGSKVNDDTSVMTNGNDSRIANSKTKQCVRGVPIQTEAEMSDGSETSDSSDYEAMMTNCYRLDLSLGDLKKLVQEHGEDDLCSDEESTLQTHRAEALSNASTKGNTPEEILASILEDDSSDEENVQTKRKRTMGPSTALPGFKGMGSVTSILDETVNEQKCGGKTQVQTSRSHSEDKTDLTKEFNVSSKDPSQRASKKGTTPQEILAAILEDDSSDEECARRKDNGKKKSNPSSSVLPAFKGTRSLSALVNDLEPELKKKRREGLSETALGEQIASISKCIKIDERAAKLKYVCFVPPPAEPPKKKKNEETSSSDDKDVEQPKLKRHVKISPASHSPLLNVVTISSSDSSEESEEEENVSQTVPTSHVQKAVTSNLPPQKVSREEKGKEDNEKRLAALVQRQKETEQQKKLIQGALANVGACTPAKGKRIVFDSDEESVGEANERNVKPYNSTTRLFSDSSSEDGDNDTESPDETGNKAAPSESSRIRVSKLFLSSDEEDDEEDGKDHERFQIKPQFEGRAGQKLMALQSKFGTDERFRMDSRFLESEDEPDEEDPQTVKETKVETLGDDGVEVQLEEEKKKNLNILQNLLHIDLQTAETSKERKNKTFKDVSALHYDPTQDEHATFEIKSEEPKKESKAARRKIREANEKLPEVSKDIYYNVAAGLNEVFGSCGQDEKKEAVAWDKEEDDERDEGGQFCPSQAEAGEQSTGFSFSFFSDEAVQEGAVKDEYKVEVLKGPKVSWQADPRFQDSSSDADSDEDGEDPVVAEDHPPDAGLNGHPAQTRNFFFFFQDDERLKEGPKMFCRAGQLKDQRETWEERRSSLIEEYRKKHKDARRRVKASMKN